MYKSGTDIIEIHIYITRANRSPWNNHNRLLSLAIFFHSLQKKKKTEFTFVSIHLCVIITMFVVIVCYSLLRFYCAPHQFNNCICIHTYTHKQPGGWMDVRSRYLQTTINQNDELTDQLSIQTANATEASAAAAVATTSTTSTDK